MKTHRYLILACVCFFLAGYVARGAVVEPLRMSWHWPSDGSNYFGNMTLRDASTNFSFIVVSSPVLSTPVTSWPVKFVIPATAVTLIATNQWETLIYDDLTFSSFYAMKVTNHLNQTESDFSLPALWLPTPRGQIRRLTK